MIVAIYAVSAAIEPFLQGGKEQGYTPDHWEPAHAGAYAANFVLIAVVAPIVEELTFRGAGYSLLAPYGQIVAIVGVGLLFGLVHGLIDGTARPVDVRDRPRVAPVADGERLSRHGRPQPLQRDRAASWR